MDGKLTCIKDVRRILLDIYDMGKWMDKIKLNLLSDVENLRNHAIK